MNDLCSTLDETGSVPWETCSVCVRFTVARLQLYETSVTLISHLNMHDVEMNFECIAPDSGARPHLSLVIPCFNEAEVLPVLKNRLSVVLDQLGPGWEVIFVDDGSSDDTLLQLTAMHSEESRFRVVALSRNFGHQVAISAGLEYCSGRIVAIMDADLQDPPELLGECLEKLSSGYDVVYAVRRK